MKNNYINNIYYFICSKKKAVSSRGEITSTRPQHPTHQVTRDHGNQPAQARLPTLPAENLVARQRQPAHEVALPPHDDVTRKGDQSGAGGRVRLEAGRRDAATPRGQGEGERSSDKAAGRHHDTRQEFAESAEFTIVESAELTIAESAELTVAESAEFAIAESAEFAIVESARTEVFLNFVARCQPSSANFLRTKR